MRHAMSPAMRHARSAAPTPCGGRWAAAAVLNAVAVVSAAGPAAAAFPEAALPPAHATILVGAGDIASCDGTDDEATGALVRELLARRPLARPFTTGDNVYPTGSLEQYQRCYGPAWGAFVERTLGVVGNHDWMTPGAAGFRATFGLPTTGPLYRAVDVGAWRVLLVDTDCDHADSCTPGSPQLVWLAGELARHKDRCTVVLGHHPRFSSGPHGSSAVHQPFWETLTQGGADLLLVGHDHIYERFEPLGAQGKPAPNGVRAITVGTGGRPGYPLKALPAAGSQVRLTGRPGVLVLTLEEGGYGFSFVTMDGAVADSGRGTCGRAP